MDATRIHRLEGVVQRYAWGSRTAIPELLGVEPDGGPWAELWLGAHPSAPARVLTEEGPVPLDAWIARDPEAVLGREVARRFGGELPFLVKILAADAPLSIQAHPNAEQARAGFERENAAGIPLDAPHRCYRDPNPKPELVCALTPFRALNRFREPEEIVAGIAALGVADLDFLLAHLRDEPGCRGVAAFFEAWMTLEPERRKGLVEVVAAAARGAGPDEAARAEVCRLAQAYPGDPGVLAPLFLNLVELAPGEAMFLDAGELHAYLGGLAVEVMASSDNVLRGGLTPKHVDVGELVSTLSFESGPVEILRPQPCGPGDARYSTPIREFRLSVLRIGSNERWEAPVSRGGEILLCKEGEVRAIDAQRRVVEFARGRSVVLPAAAGAYAVEGDGVVYRATCGEIAAPS